MAIIQPGQIAGRQKNLRVLLSGPPGVGKTTAALSAPRPLLIDADKGIERISAAHRCPFIQPHTYQELVDDLTPENVKGYDTLVVDTLGSLLKLMGTHAIRQDPKNGKRDGSLSLPGYGAISKLFEGFMAKCAMELDKNVVVVSHTKEQQKGDEFQIRLLADGSTRDTIYQSMDLAGFMHIQGSQRAIGFSPTDSYFAKGTFGIVGVEPVGELMPGAPNDYLGRLFSRVRDNIASDAQQYAKARQAYDEAMGRGREMLSHITDAECANAALAPYKAIPNALTSRQELECLWFQRMQEIGAEWSHSAGAFIDGAPAGAAR